MPSIAKQHVISEYQIHKLPNLNFRDEVSYAKQCINKYRSRPQPPSGCGNFNWFRYMEPDMERVWMAEINGKRKQLNYTWNYLQ